jgi:hypothetical protein
VAPFGNPSIAFGRKSLSPFCARGIDSPMTPLCRARCAVSIGGRRGWLSAVRLLTL